MKRATYTFLQINEGGKYDADKGLEVMRELITNDDDYKVLETTSKDCVSG